MDELLSELNLMHVEYKLKKKNKEIFISEYNLSDVNKIIDLAKKAKIRKILFGFTVLSSFGLDFLNSISDKDMVYFFSKDNINVFSVDDLINLEKLMDLMVKDIKESNLSPYEKYIAVYNIVRSFKEYQYYKKSREEDHKIIDQSRNVYLVLINKWIVCAGYSHLLNSLLQRVGIPSISWRANNNNHAINCVHIKDDKYGIDGFYFCDATKDASEKDIILSPGVYMNCTLEQIHEFNFSMQINNEGIFSGYIPFMINFLKLYKKNAELIIKSLDYEYYLSIKSEFDSYGKTDSSLKDLDLADKLCTYFSKMTSQKIGISKEIQAVVRVQEFINGKPFSEEEFKKLCNECLENLKISHKNKL